MTARSRRQQLPAVVRGDSDVEDHARRGRTEQFTPVKLSATAAPGMILALKIAAHDGRQLLEA